VLVGGLPGTGKSTVAAAVADRMGYALLSSDDRRHQLEPGGGRGDGYGAGLYRPEMTASTYTALLSQAGRALAFGEHVIIDASWTDARWRRKAAETAVRGDARLVELMCVAPASIATARIHQRRAVSGALSDATPAIAQQMEADADPWPSARRVDTTSTVDDAVAAALSEVDPYGRGKGL
jgi:hypothetical protein